jgi:tetratricopeptide (TPR) repeat protein
MGHYVLARIEQSQGNFSKSIPMFEKALAIRPDAIETITGLIRSYVRLDQTDEALSFLENFVAEHPENVQGVTLWGEMLARDQQWELARTKNEEALELDPNWLPAYRNLVGLHLRAGENREADGMIGEGLERSPGNADLLMIRASIYEKEERWSDAIAIYEDLLGKNNGLDIAANNYIALIADHRLDPSSLEKAMRYGQRFQNSDNPIFQDTLGWLYYRMGDLDEAVPLLEQAVAKAGTLQQLRYHLGMAYFKQDKLDLARRELEASVKNEGARYPGFDEAKQTLDRL